ncbi:MAG: transcription termination factor Rho [Clostridia bacterium]|nr:transcription termination factor Rho [Clostridia bacterium]
MDYQSLHNKTVVELRKLAKDLGVRVPAGTNKSTLIDMLLEADRAASQAREATAKAREAAKAAEKPADHAEGADRAAEPAAKPAVRGRKPKAAEPEEMAKPARTTARRGAAKKSDAPKAQESAARSGAPEKADASDAGEARKRAGAATPAADAASKVAGSASPAGGPAPAAEGARSSAAEKAPAEADGKSAEAPQKPAETSRPEAVPTASVERRPAVARPSEVQAQPAQAGNAEAQNPARIGDGAYRPKNGEDVLRPAMRPRVPETARGDALQRPNARYGRPQGHNVPVDSRPQRYAPDAANRAPRTMGNRYARPADAPRTYDNNQNRPYDNRQGGYDNGQNRSYDSQSRNPDVQGRLGEGQVQPRSAVPESAAPEVSVEREATRQRAEQAGGEFRTSAPAAPEMPAVGEYGEGAGVLEIQPDGYGFLRAENCLPGPNDVYISIAQIRRFCLRNGDYVEGKTRPQREGDRYSAIMFINKVNGESPEKAVERPRFEDLVPIYPDERLRLEPSGGKQDLSMRLIDMLAPIGKGQRGMIVSQPKAGKTTLLKKVANAITSNYPDVHLIVLLIDERPEEVTDMKRSIDGEVVYSTFDEVPENHTRVSEMVLDRAQRLVEMGKDVVVLMDSITRLARAYNLTITPTGRSLSGGLDPGALFKPKRFFGAARNIENGGSLTIIATALVETGSRMDDIIFEEFKGTGNMELHLDRKLSDRRVFPAIDLLKSGTRREELLLSNDEMNGELQVRRMLSGGKQQEMYESLIDLMSKTATNAEFFEKLKGWLAVYEKEGYTLGR